MAEYFCTQLFLVEVLPLREKLRREMLGLRFHLVFQVSIKQKLQKIVLQAETYSVTRKTK